MHRALIFTYTIFLMLGAFTAEWVYEGGLTLSNWHEIIKAIIVHIGAAIFALFAHYMFESSERFHEERNIKSVSTKYISIGFIFSYIFGFVFFLIVVFNPTPFIKFKEYLEQFI